MVIVRPEQPADIPAIHRVNAQAFGRLAEALLVDALRAHGKALISLVAVKDAQVVGHILFSPVTIASATGPFPAVGLAPMAVVPALQRQGIGTLLVQRGLAACRRARYACAVVLGHAHYYPRFGFVPAQRYGIESEYAVPSDVFMALELQEGALQGHAGVARYAPEFQAV
jgi:putative acetyltransferase